ncbi:hypothetical protein G3M55_54340, partial [Streptomyces sp. SID8455]|nr:hypothetical protein [Streptomyces sp. SID8455]
ALTAHPAVAQTTVTVREDTPGTPRIVAYTVPTDDDTAGEAPDLHTWLADRLPAYMVPTAFVTLTALPRNTSGKIDRKALPAPDLAASTADHTAPTSETEHTLCRIWAEALGLERVGT